MKLTINDKIKSGIDQRFKIEIVRSEIANRVNFIRKNCKQRGRSVSSIFIIKTEINEEDCTCANWKCVFFEKAANCRLSESCLRQ